MWTPSPSSTLSPAAAVVGLLLLMLQGCAVTSLQSPSTRRPYDREASNLHPSWSVHRLFGQQHVDLYVQMSRQELLYSRLDTQAPFVSQLEISLGDTTWQVLDTAWATTTDTLRLKLEWQPEENVEWAVLQIEDVMRNSTWSETVNLGPSDRLSSSDLLIWSAKNQWPLSDQNASVGDTLLIALPSAAWQESAAVWAVYSAASPSQFPAPPYSQARLRWDTIQPVPLGEIIADSAIVLVVPEGTTLLQLQGNPLKLLFHGRNPSFPELTSAQDLIAPTRYIASRSEYARMSSAEHPKKALDEFWLNCNASPESARNLLQTYYSRVEEANHAFSGLVEGWKTDRGMVHIVFGIPQRVRKDSWNEYWIYGEEGTANALTFHFRRRSFMLDDNCFELDRSMQFRSVWDRGISNWRNGRVRGD